MPNWLFPNLFFAIVEIRCTNAENGILLENKSKFVSLNRILIILTIILISAYQPKAQETRGPGGPENNGRILKMYPNPATTYITFDIQKNYQKNLTLTIYSFLGKKMSETPNVNEKTTLTLTDYNRGMYVYHLTDQSGKVIDTGKFQVSR